MALAVAIGLAEAFSQPLQAQVFASNSVTGKVNGKESGRVELMAPSSIDTGDAPRFSSSAKNSWALAARNSACQYFIAGNY